MNFIVLITFDDWQEIFINDEFYASAHHLDLSEILTWLSGGPGFWFKEYYLQDDTPEEILNKIFPYDNTVKFSERRSYVEEYAE